MPSLLILAFCVLMISNPAIAAIHHEVFYSESMGEDRALAVYVPRTYDPDRPEPYPVVYFLHGAFSTHTIYIEILEDALDELINHSDPDEAIEPVIAVLPDGDAGDFGGTEWLNSPLWGDVQDYAVFDVVEFVEENYNAYPGPEKRAIMGFSSGGNGAMCAALLHHERYAAVASHSGTLAFDEMTSWIPDILVENGGAPPYVYSPDAGLYTAQFFIFAGAISPNFFNPPYLIDFPLDAFGNLIDSIWDLWLAESPTVLAEGVPVDTDLAIYFDCGTQDQHGLFAHSEAFAEALDELGLPYEFQPFEGNHSGQLAARLRISLKWIDAVFAGGITNTASELPAHRIVLSNYPNPFNPQTTVSFWLPHSAWTSVSVYDLTGRQVITLASQQFDAGRQTLTWTGRDSGGCAVPSGTYIVRLETEERVESRKVMLVR
jgi:enterochelin esterase-like enzyme